MLQRSHAELATLIGPVPPSTKTGLIMIQTSKLQATLCIEITPTCKHLGYQVELGDANLKVAHELILKSYLPMSFMKKQTHP